MKLAISLFAVVLTLTLGACSYKSGVTKANLVPAFSESGTVVHLQENSFAPGGRVVRLAH